MQLPDPEPHCGAGVTTSLIAETVFSWALPTSWSESSTLLASTGGSCAFSIQSNGIPTLHPLQLH